MDGVVDGFEGGAVVADEAVFGGVAVGGDADAEQEFDELAARYWGVLIKGWREKGENRFFGEKKSKYIGNTHKETKIQKKRCYNTDIATVIRFIYV